MVVIIHQKYVGNKMNCLIVNFTRLESEYTLNDFMSILNSAKHIMEVDLMRFNLLKTSIDDSHKFGAKMEFEAIDGTRHKIEFCELQSYKIVQMLVWLPDFELKIFQKLIALYQGGSTIKKVESIIERY